MKVIKLNITIYKENEDMDLSKGKEFVKKIIEIKPEDFEITVDSRTEDVEYNPSSKEIDKAVEVLKEDEVELAIKGSPLAEFQKERTDALSEMLDNSSGVGIYPTSKFFARFQNILYF